jgi:membrane protein
MSEPGEDGAAPRWRTVAAQVIERIGGNPAVRTLVATLGTYDRAGGGLVAGGLAYAALIALLPGLLLALSVFGLLVDDPAIREDLVGTIATAFPPVEELVRGALEQVSAGAVPTGIIAIVGLLWGSSRFYAALDYAFSRVFHNAPRRNEIVRTLRGLVVTGLFVALPIAAAGVGAVAAWLLDAAPSGPPAGALEQLLLRVGSPLAAVLLFVGGTMVVYRFVPATRVPVRAFGMPALVVGLVLAAFTQAFALIAPLLFGMAALFGTLVTAFALLAWLSIGFNVLLLGAAWTHVRAGPAPDLAASSPAPAPEPSGPPATTGTTGTTG